MYLFIHFIYIYYCQHVLTAIYSNKVNKIIVEIDPEAWILLQIPIIPNIKFKLKNLTNNFHTKYKKKTICDRSCTSYATISIILLNILSRKGGQKNVTVRDLRVLFWSGWEMRHYGLLCSGWWKLLMVILWRVLVISYGLLCGERW